MAVAEGLIVEWAASRRHPEPGPRSPEVPTLGSKLRSQYIGILDIIVAVFLFRVRIAKIELL